MLNKKKDTKTGWRGHWMFGLCLILMFALVLAAGSLSRGEDENFAEAAVYAPGSGWNNAADEDVSAGSDGAVTLSGQGYYANNLFDRDYYTQSGKLTVTVEFTILAKPSDPAADNRFGFFLRNRPIGSFSDVDGFCVPGSTYKGAFFPTYPCIPDRYIGPGYMGTIGADFGYPFTVQNPTHYGLRQTVQFEITDRTFDLSLNGTHLGTCRDESTGEAANIGSMQDADGEIGLYLAVTNTGGQYDLKIHNVYTDGTPSREQRPEGWPAELFDFQVFDGAAEGQGTDEGMVVVSKEGTAHDALACGISAKTPLDLTKPVRLFFDYTAGSTGPIFFNLNNGTSALSVDPPNSRYHIAESGTLRMFYFMQGGITTTYAGSTLQGDMYVPCPPKTGSYHTAVLDVGTADTKIYVNGSLIHTIAGVTRSSFPEGAYLSVGGAWWTPDIPAAAEIKLRVNGEPSVTGPSNFFRSVTSTKEIAVGVDLDLTFVKGVDVLTEERTLSLTEGVHYRYDAAAKKVVLDNPALVSLLTEEGIALGANAYTIRTTHGNLEFTVEHQDSDLPEFSSESIEFDKHANGGSPPDAAFELVDDLDLTEPVLRNYTAAEPISPEDFAYLTSEARLVIRAEYLNKLRAGVYEFAFDSKSSDGTKSNATVVLTVTVKNDLPPELEGEVTVVYRASEGSDLSVRFSANKGIFGELAGTEPVQPFLTPDAYSVSEGELILKASYLNRLGTGLYSFEMTFDNGTISFTVRTFTFSEARWSYTPGQHVFESADGSMTSRAAGTSAAAFFSGRTPFDLTEGIGIEYTVDRYLVPFDTGSDGAYFDFRLTPAKDAFGWVSTPGLDLVTRLHPEGYSVTNMILSAGHSAADALPLGDHLSTKYPLSDGQTRYTHTAAVIVRGNVLHLIMDGVSYASELPSTFSADFTKFYLNAALIDTNESELQITVKAAQLSGAWLNAGGGILTEQGERGYRFTDRAKGTGTLLGTRPLDLSRAQKFCFDMTALPDGSEPSDLTVSFGAFGAAGAGAAASARLLFHEGACSIALGTADVYRPAVSAGTLIDGWNELEFVFGGEGVTVRLNGSEIGVISVQIDASAETYLSLRTHDENDETLGVPYSVFDFGFYTAQSGVPAADRTEADYNLAGAEENGLNFRIDLFDANFVGLFKSAGADAPISEGFSFDQRTGLLTLEHALLDGLYTEDGPCSVRFRTIKEGAETDIVFTLHLIRNPDASLPEGSGGFDRNLESDLEIEFFINQDEITEIRAGEAAITDYRIDSSSDRLIVAWSALAALPVGRVEIRVFTTALPEGIVFELTVTDSTAPSLTGPGRADFDVQEPADAVFEIDLAFGAFLGVDGLSAEDFKADTETDPDGSSLLTLTFRADTLAKLGTGIKTFVVRTTYGDLAVSVKAVNSVPPALVPDGDGIVQVPVFDAGEPGDVEARIAENRGNFLSVTGYGIEAEDYSYEDGRVRIKQEFLSGLAAGEHHFAVNLDNGTVVLTIRIVKPEIPAFEPGKTNPYLAAGLAVMGGLVLIGTGAGLILHIGRKKGKKEGKS